MTDNKSLPHWIKVSELASHGVQAEEIAGYLGIPKNELIRDYSILLRRAALDKTIEVAKKLYDCAMDGNTTAMAMWLKAHGQWEELAKRKPEITEDQVFESINIVGIDE